MYTNDATRKKLIDFRTKYLMPRIKEIAIKVGISRSYLTEFLNNKAELSQKKLIAINNFIDTFESKVNE